MNLATFFGSVKSAQRARVETKGATFAELARKVANDEALDPNSVANELDELGRSAEELATAAQLIVDRRAWAALLPRDAGLHAEHNKLHGKLAEAEAGILETIRTARAAHAVRVATIQQRLVNIVIEQDSAQTGRNRLLQTATQWPRLAKLQSERAACLVEIQKIDEAFLQTCRMADKGGWLATLSIARAKALQLAVEIAKLEREALLP